MDVSIVVMSEVLYLLTVSPNFPERRIAAVDAVNLWFDKHFAVCDCHHHRRPNA